MTEFKQIVGRGTRVHEDTKKFYFTLIDFRGATSHFADPDFDGEPVQIYEPGEDDPDRAARRRAARRRRRRDRCRDKPGADETVIDGPPDITLPLDRRQDEEGLCRWRRRDHHRRARGISGRERQARHREPARLHQEGAEEALRQPRRLPEALEGGRAQAGDHRGTGGRGPAARSASPRKSARTSIPST